MVVKTLTDERDNAYQEINNLNKKLTRLEDALNLKEEESERLGTFKKQQHNYFNYFNSQIFKVDEIAQLHRQIDNEKTHAEQVSSIGYYN